MTKSGCALILPGVVAKGAYEAGVLSVVAEREISVDRLVAASSGSLNAVVFAAGIRAGRARAATGELMATWIEHGSWHESLHFNGLAMVSGKGLSDHRGILKLLTALVKPCTSDIKFPVTLDIVVAPLNGLDGKIGANHATTFEGILQYTGEDFDSAEGLARIFEAACAACAFPGLFTPVEIPGLGPCIDGGAVDNNPIKYAMSDETIDRIIVPVAYPAVLPPPETRHGVTLIEHMADVLLNERLYRDLKGAEETNRKLKRLDALVATNRLSAKQLAEVTSILDWRPVQIMEIRPAEILPGNLFSGFLDRDLRAKYIEMGKASAQKIL